MKRTTSRKRIAGATMVEFALIAPLLMLVGLGLIQTGLVFQNKSALKFALQEAARSGATGNANPTSIQNGLLRGLVPYMGGGLSAGDIIATTEKAGLEFARGTAEGWVRVKQLSPSPQSFDDWEQNSTDDSGNPVVEIPNANLPVLRCTAQPKSGSAGTRASSACRGGEPIGSSSQQTLADANLLKLQMTYGVKMSVPIINQIVVKALAMMAGCAAPAPQQFGMTNLGTPAVGAADPAACAAYNAVDAEGHPDPRIPMSLAITVRMQTPARSANNNAWFDVVARSREANTSGVKLGNGTVDAATQFAPLPVAQLNPNGVTQADDTMNKTGVGSTHVGDPNETLGDDPPITCTGSP